MILFSKALSVLVDESSDSRKKSCSPEICRTYIVSKDGC